MPRTVSLVAVASTLLSGCASLSDANTQLTAPEEPLASGIRAAIWDDVQSNALIGNGNDLLFLWANAAVDRTSHPQLHIRELRCSSGSSSRTCKFALLREGGAATYYGETAPDKLACSAQFRRSGRNENWTIPRLPPVPGDAHSRITIECTPVT
ncbi:MAG: hypothetical protein EBR82_09180 [Caulobacteraceae bacterium]|nr:hypothetical protein [Caulobacteraceae bacterium]